MGGLRRVSPVGGFRYLYFDDWICIVGVVCNAVFVFSWFNVGCDLVDTLRSGFALGVLIGSCDI